MVRTGISGSTTPAAASQARCRNSASLGYGGHHVAPGKVRCIDCSSLSRWPRCSLCRPLRPPCCIQSLLGRASVASLDDIGNRLQPLRPQRRGIDGDAGIDQGALAVVETEHLAGKGPEIVDRGLRAAMAFRRCRRRAGPSIPTNAANDRRFPSRTSPRSPPASRRSTSSSRASRDRRRRSRKTAAPWCARNRRSAVPAAADCGTA